MTTPKSLTPQPPETSDIRSWLDARRPSRAGRLVGRFCPIRRAVVRSNMRIVFPDLDEAGIAKLCALFCDNLLTTIWEILRFPFVSDEKLKQSVRLIGVDRLLEAAKKNRGILISTGHFGNWETTPVAAIQHFPEFKGRFHFMRRPIGTRWIERALFGRYYRAGLDIIPKRHSMSRVLDALANNETVVFIMDQYANTSKEGIDVEFFGKKAGTFRSLALVAKRSGAPVIPSYSYRAADGTHVMEFWPALEWIEDDDSDREIYLNTLAYNAAMENMVRAHPDQWWWPHRRWKVK